MFFLKQLIIMEFRLKSPFIYLFIFLSIYYFLEFMSRVIPMPQDLEVSMDGWGQGSQWHS